MFSVIQSEQLFISILLLFPQYVKLSAFCRFFPAFRTLFLSLCFFWNYYTFFLFWSPVYQYYSPISTGEKESIPYKIHLVFFLKFYKLFKYCDLRISEKSYGSKHTFLKTQKIPSDTRTGFSFYSLSFFSDRLSFLLRTDQFHFFFYSSLDCFKAGSQQFSWVKPFAFQVFSCFDIFTGSICKCQLAFCVYVDFGNT